MSRSGELWQDEQEKHDKFNFGYMEGEMAMAKKDFELIADILCGQKVEKSTSVAGYKQWLAMVIKFEDALARTHPSFNRSRFLEACHALSPDTAKFLKLSEKK